MRYTCVKSRSQAISRYRPSKVRFTKTHSKRCGGCGGDGRSLDNKQACRRCGGTGETLS